MRKECNLLNRFMPFVMMVIFYVVSIFILRTIDFLFIGDVNDFSGIIYGNLISSLSLSVCVLVFYLIISFVSKKSAAIVAAILFSLLFLAEAGLMVYHKSTGLLMGNEIILRPLWETLFTIKSTLNFWIILGTTMLIFVYIILSLFLSKKNINNFITCIVLLSMIVSVPLFLIIKPKQDKYVVNKMWYCIYSCFLEKNELHDENHEKINLSKVEYDEDKVQEFKRIFMNGYIVDNQYPLERKDDVDNVLGTYFKKSKSKPNIVVVIVESLGSDIFGTNEYSYTFTPFLDSLSRHSLLWVNCLSSTPRSFGAVPAITGSVPHGTKGFQFGDIPEHNSLYSVLRNNGYTTSAFYAGDFSFDMVYDYLIAQKIDFLAPLNEDQKKKENRHYDYTYWGYQDKIMFEKSMDIIEQREDSKPNFDLFITISQHDNRLKLMSKERTDYYYEKARNVISTLPEEEQEAMNESLGFLAAAMYGDDALKYFFERYRKYDEDDNTIYIITGDHSLNLKPEDPLNSFHVPLIIWSPLLKESKTFEAVVSHNDIVPTINALLRDNYKFKTPNKIHWMGKALDTASRFRCDMNICFLRYTRKITDGIFGDYYYTFEGGTKNAFKIKKDLKLENINDTVIIKDIENKFNSLVYVDNYAYTNNKLTANPIFAHEEFNLIENVVIDSVYCSSNDEKPSEKKPKAVEIFSMEIDSKYEEIKIVMTADIKYTGKVWQDQFINLGIDCYQDKNHKINSIDNISKSIVEKNYSEDRWMKLEITKTFSVKDFDSSNLDIYMKPTFKDYFWNPDHSVTLKNINIAISASEYVNNQ